MLTFVSDAEQRGEARQATWVGGVAASFEHLEALDAELALEDLIANKRASGRPQDLADVALLESLRDGRR